MVLCLRLVTSVQLPKVLMLVSQPMLVLVLLLVMLISLDRVLDVLRSKLVLVHLRSLLVQEVRSRVGVGTLTPILVLWMFVVDLFVLRVSQPSLINTTSSRVNRSVLNQSVTIASIGSTSVTHSSFGPVTIYDGVTVTVDSGATWTIT